MLTWVGVQRVVARRAATRVQHAQREALHPMAVVVAPGQQVPGAEQLQMLIGLGNQVVAVVRERRGECFIPAAWPATCPRDCWPANS